MQLTPIPDDILPTAIEMVRAALVPGTMALAVFDRIAATQALVANGYDTAEHRAQAVELCRRFGIATIDEAPQVAYSYDGQAIRTRSEAYVLIHEVAHWLVAPPERRTLKDFGLGAGPETGEIEAANAALCVGKETQIEEEALASLLGILWEVELGQPAILAFLEQNWLEGWERPEACAANLADNVQRLHERGLIDAASRPIPPESCRADSRHAA